MYMPYAGGCLFRAQHFYEFVAPINDSTFLDKRQRKQESGMNNPEIQAKKWTQNSNK